MRASFLRRRSSDARRARVGAKTVAIHRLGIPWRRAKALARQLYLTVIREEKPA